VRGGRLLAALAGAVAVIWLAGLAGLWWVTVLAGLGLGLAAGRARVGVGAGLAAGLLGWGLPLAWLATRVPLRPTGEAVAGILGFPGAGGLAAYALTLLVGALLGGAGGWLGAAASGVARLRADRAG
jgi:hypothetical protein